MPPLCASNSENRVSGFTILSFEAAALQAVTGPLGNSRLTALTGSVLLVLLAAEGATLISLRSLVSWHIFIGMLLIPVVALKVASTGYRFVRYYTHTEDYVHVGPPLLLLRLLGPIVVLSSVALFATGVALAWLGPSDSFVYLLHKASFIVWVGAMSIHVLGHILRLPKLAVPDVHDARRAWSARLRLSLVAATILLGTALAVSTLPLTHVWTHAVH
jgi:hypothetical protein